MTKPSSNNIATRPCGGAPPGAPVRFVLGTPAPARDTPARLATLHDGFSLDDRWTLLRGDEEHVRQMAALLGIRHGTEAGGQIAHSNVGTIRDRDGQVTASREGPGLVPGPAVAAVADLLAAR